MKIQFDEKGTGCMITCDGDLTQRSMQEARTMLIKALITTNDVVIDMNKVTRVDLACLQLLCSAHRSAQKLKKKIALAGNIRPDALIRAAEAAGYVRACGCSIDQDGSCFWRNTI